MSPETPHNDVQWSSSGEDPSRDPILLGNLVGQTAAQIENQREFSAALAELKTMIETGGASEAELQAVRDRVGAARARLQSDDS